MIFVEALLPKGPLGQVQPMDRRRFFKEREFVPGIALSSSDGAATHLRVADVRTSAWLPGTLEHVYGDATPRSIAIREHVARAQSVHPGQVTVDGDTGRIAHLSLTRFPVTVDETSEFVRVTDAGPPVLDITLVRKSWRERLKCGSWRGEDILLPLIERFVRRVVLNDPDAFQAVVGKPVLYVCNHQTAIESLLFCIVATALGGRPVVAIAKDEHRESWLGRLIALIGDHPGVALPRLIAYFDRSDPSSMLPMLDDLKSESLDNGASVMIHAEGTRSVHCRRPVERVSGVFTDLGLTIVPVRFMGGLPILGRKKGERLEFPVGYGTQDIIFGNPISPEEMAALPLDGRQRRILDDLNGLGPDLMEENPSPPDPVFSEEIERLMKERNIGMPQAVVLHLMDKPDGDAPEDDWSRQFDNWVRS